MGLPLGSPAIPDRPPRPLALVVEDSAETRTLLAEFARQRGFDVAEAADGVEGVEAARRLRPDLILIDVRMPRMDGLTALAEIREEDPTVAVVVVSSDPDRGRMDQALALGAVNFVRKPVDKDELDFVLDRIYRAVEEEADLRQILEVVAERTTIMSFPGSPSALSRVVSYLGRELRNHYPGFQLPFAEVKLALYETLANAVEHGNLGISFEEKTSAMHTSGGMEALIRQRLADPLYAGRLVHVHVDYLPDRVVYTIRDEGQGFDPRTLSATPLADTSALHGRGLALVRHYMDEVGWNDRGNEIRMSRRLAVRESRSRPAEGEGQAGNGAAPSAATAP
jgi:CheY-like chemotaxis protein